MASIGGEPTALLTPNRQPQTFDTSEESSYQYDDCCPGLDITQRIIGFLACVFLGFFVNLLSIARLHRLLIDGDPAPYAAALSLGNLLSLGSSLFFVGPTKQIKMMAEPKRAMTALLYVASIVATLILALWKTFEPNWVRILLLLLFCFMQFCTMLWYSLSYVPYAQRCLTNVLCSCSCCKP